MLVALATILGHNFPVYLKLRGGKGVATSLGALLALDPFASGATVAAFVIFLIVTRYVSLSSLLGGLVFVVVHFARTDRPWDRDQRAMSLATLALLVLLVARHRKNLARIGAGTEPKVGMGRKRPEPPSGRVATGLLVAIVVAPLAVGLVIQAVRRPELTVGPYRLVETARVATGHQRAERLAFADRGRLLAVTCPRYNRVVLYGVAGEDGLKPVREIVLEGRPVAVWPTADRLYVLQRPAGDALHLEEGWWETFDFEGRRDRLEGPRRLLPRRPGGDGRRPQCPGADLGPRRRGSAPARPVARGDEPGRRGGAPSRRRPTRLRRARR